MYTFAMPKFLFSLLLPLVQKGNQSPFFGFHYADHTFSAGKSSLVETRLLFLGGCLKNDQNEGRHADENGGQNQGDETV